MKDFELKKEVESLRLEDLPEFFGYRSPLIHKPAKYRKRHEHDLDDVKDLRFGTRIVVCIKDSSDVHGYLLGRILDICEEGYYFYSNSTLVYIVEQSSHWKLDWMIGRIRSVELGYFKFRKKHSVMIGSEYFPKRVDKPQ